MSTRQTRPEDTRPALIFRILAVATLLLAVVLASATTLFLASPVVPVVPLAAPASDPDLAQAITYLQRSIALDPLQSDAYTRLADAYSLAGDDAAVVAVWQKAVTADPGSTWPLDQLGRWQLAQGNYSAAQQVFASAMQLAPNDQELAANLANATQAAADHVQIQQYLNTHHLTAQNGSFTTLNQPLESGWKLIGYWGDESRLLDGSAAPAWFFWRAPNAEAVPGLAAAGWQSIQAGLWVQHAPALRNQIYDGSFERSAVAERILGFPNTIYPSSSNTAQLKLTTRAGQSTTVGSLINSPTQTDTSMVSNRLPVTGTQALLLSGWLRSTDGAPYLGLLWQGNELSPSGVKEEYVHSGQPSARWLHAAGLIERPTGAAEVQVVLLNAHTSGTAMFDEIVSLPIQVPQASPTVQ